MIFRQIIILRKEKNYIVYNNEYFKTLKEISLIFFLLDIKKNVYHKKILRNLTSICALYENHVTLFEPAIITCISSYNDFVHLNTQGTVNHQIKMKLKVSCEIKT